MRAATYRLTGPGAGALAVREVPDPVPGPGEVLVRVAISGVNPTDWKARRSGGLQSLDAEYVIPGQDGAGVIEAVGERVDPGRVGERVWLLNAQWGRPFGTAAELVALPSEQAIALPQGAPFELGASLGIPYVTAHRCLTAGGGPVPRRVLVSGGAGAVGHAAIELGVFIGACVAATVSDAEKARIASDAGAETVIDYRSQDVAEAVLQWSPDGVERIVEVAIERNLEVDSQVIAAGGTISSYAVSGEPVSLGRPLMSKNVALQFVLTYTIPDDAKRSAVATITAALEAGALSLLPLHRFPLEEIAAAHDAVENGAVGKVLVEIA